MKSSPVHVQQPMMSIVTTLKPLPMNPDFSRGLSRVKMLSLYLVVTYRESPCLWWSGAVVRRRNLLGSGCLAPPPANHVMLGNITHLARKAESRARPVASTWHVCSLIVMARSCPSGWPPLPCLPLPRFPVLSYLTPSVALFSVSGLWVLELWLPHSC